MLAPKPARVQKLLELLPRILESGRLSSGEASSLAGKLMFLLSTVFGRVGRPAMWALFQHAKTSGSASTNTEDEQTSDARDSIPEYVREALSFFLGVLPLLPPKRVWFHKKRQLPIYVWTDAAYAKGSAEPGGLGLSFMTPIAFDGITLLPPSGMSGRGSLLCDSNTLVSSSA